MAKIVLFNKPYGVHSQFRKEHEQMQTLADFFKDKSLRVAGRLDKDSEGLLILTDSGSVNHAITTPPNKGGGKRFGKTYLVQVENVPSAEQITQLEQGVELKDGKTLPCQVRLLDELPIDLWERDPPIRERKAIPTAWLAITIYEGKNRQVRRMVAHVGLPCLRLIRQQIGSWSLVHGGHQLGVGEHCEIMLDKSAMAHLGLDDTKSTPSTPKRTDVRTKQARYRQAKPTIRAKKR
ncbi:MAG: pseudouridine synthase [Moraxella sp.]|nr:pseudouridine synthase [Moraxella sp.]